MCHLIRNANSADKRDNNSLHLVGDVGRSEKKHHKLTWERWLHDAIRVPFYSSISPWHVVTSCIAKWIGLNSAERKCSTRSHDFTYLKASTGFRSLPPFFFTCSTTTMVNITRNDEKSVLLCDHYLISHHFELFAALGASWYALFFSDFIYLFKNGMPTTFLGDDSFSLITCCSFISISNQMGDPCTTASLDVPYADPANYDGLTFYGVSDFQNLIQINRPNSLF